jgi:hypothetical protein
MVVYVYYKSSTPGFDSNHCGTARAANKRQLFGFIEVGGLISDL